MKGGIADEPIDRETMASSEIRVRNINESKKNLVLLVLMTS
ncbi:MAG: hypothetical protein QXV95_03465 [Sulfolobales archaeon]